MFFHNISSALNFDVFAAIFYLLSRYEELLNEPLDKHVNYDFKNSILFRHKISPYIGEELFGIIKETIVNGITVYQNRKIMNSEIKNGNIILSTRGKM